MRNIPAATLINMIITSIRCSSIIKNIIVDKLLLSSYSSFLFVSSDDDVGDDLRNDLGDDDDAVAVEVARLLLLFSCDKSISQDELHCRSLLPFLF